MSLAIIDGREWQSARDLRTGEKAPADSPCSRMVSDVLRSHPFPGDIDARGNKWVTDTALDLAGRYDPHLAFLVYAQQYYALRFDAPPPDERAALIAAAFEEARRFAKEGGFFPVIVGTGDMIPVAAYIDLSHLDGLAVVTHWLTRYAGLYGPSEKDMAYLRSLPEIERIVDRRDYMALFAGTPAEDGRLPDYLAVSKEGCCFRSTLLRQARMVAAANEFLPVANLEAADALTDISAGVLELLKTRKVALILMEGVGLRDFPLPARRCRNGPDWFNYEPCECQHLTVSTGRHQALAYPAGYRSYLEDDENKEYPLSGYFTSIPAGTVGTLTNARSIAVGNRSMFMHTVTGADIAIECFARNLANQGCMAVIHRQDKYRHC
ncbi:hypothetical protein [Anaeroselena agilis]|uniref:Uncharacterized protein n=1 Tax=Anaeroselena agilis TaxID=3063788 RepID=A0ABU3NSH1_9FIRM|nr:hypothetical protein [Selenomonadales bacterium 4137-cl]